LEKAHDNALVCFVFKNIFFFKLFQFSFLLQGNRFALAQSKMGLASILSKFDLHLCERTDYPMTLDPSQFTITAVGGIWLKATPRCQD